MCSLENVESIQQKFEWTALLRLPIEVLELYPLLKYVFICVLFTSLLHQACIVSKAMPYIISAHSAEPKCQYYTYIYSCSP